MLVQPPPPADDGQMPPGVEEMGVGEMRGGLSRCAGIKRRFPAADAGGGKNKRPDASKRPDESRGRTERRGRQTDRILRQTARDADVQGVSVQIGAQLKGNRSKKKLQLQLHACVSLGNPLPIMGRSGQGGRLC